MSRLLVPAAQSSETIDIVMARVTVPDSFIINETEIWSTAFSIFEYICVDKIIGIDGTGSCALSRLKYPREPTEVVGNCRLCSIYNNRW